MGCTASHQSNAAADVELVAPESWSQKLDDILLELLGKWKEEKMLGRDTDGKKNLVVKHLFHQKSFFKALTILARDYYGLLFSTRRVMMRKFPTQYRLLILYSCTSIMGCTASNDSNALVDVELVTRESCSQKLDAALLKSLAKLKLHNMLGKANFLVERLLLRASLLEALASVGNHTALGTFIESVIEHKFSILVVPEDLPELLPEDLSEVLPEVLPEDLPEVLLEVLPDDLPEILTEDLPQLLTEDPPELLPEDLHEDLPDDLPDDLPEMLTEDLPELLPEDLPEILPEMLPELLLEVLPDDLPEMLTEDLPEDLPELLTEDPPELLPEDLHEDLPDDLPEMLTEDLSELLTEDLPELLPEDLHEDLLEDLSETLPEVVPELLPEVVPELLPAVLPELLLATEVAPHPSSFTSPNLEGVTGEVLESVAYNMDTWILGLILDLLGKVMKSPVQAGELEFLVERLCLSTSFDMASAFFEAAMAFEPAKIRLISDFTDTIKTRRFPTPQKAGTLMDPVVNPTPIEQALAAIKDSEDEEPDAPRP